MLEVVLIGAGPYGLSIAAHLRHRGIPFRFFGRPMDSWLNHMPKGMMLKSDGFASNLSDPNGEYTLAQFCADRGIEYADAGIPVKLDTFSAYGLAFQARIVPELEEKLVVKVARSKDGFSIQLDDGETLETRRIVLAVGISHFECIPPELAVLSADFVSHSFQHHDPQSLRGRTVVVVGGGASALDLAGLLHRAGVHVQLLVRDKSLSFHDKGPALKERTLWQRLRRPSSGLGPGLRSRFCSEWPMLFYYLPQEVRLKIVRNHLGPSGGWFTKDLVVGKVPTLLGFSIEHAETRAGKAHLHLRGADGTVREISADHVIAATGYKVDINRLAFLDPEVRDRLALVQGSPVLSSTFESSVPGLYFVGLAAANSFGPVMRFAYGAAFAARRITKTMRKLVAVHREAFAVSQIEAVRNRGPRAV